MSKVAARAKKMKCEDEKFWECQQVIFEAGDTLPEHLEGTAKVETKDGQLCFAADEVLPEDFAGSFLVDPCTGESRYLPSDVIPLEQFKASDELPDFNGPLEVYTLDGVETVFGAETAPADMQGIIFCIDGEVCYVGSPPPAVETVTTLTVNADGSATYVNELGVVTTIPAPVVSQMSLAGSVFTHTSGDGTVVSVDMCAVIAQNCNSPMVVNADGSVTYTDNAGTVVTIPAPVYSQMSVAGSTITHTSGDGTVVEVDVCAMVAGNCNSPMVVNADGSVTYTDNAGVMTTIPAPVPETVTTLTVNDDGSVTYVSEDGTQTVIPAPVVSQLSLAGSVFTHTSGDGTSVSIDICAVVAANCNATMNVNADGSVDYTDNAGNSSTIPAVTPSQMSVAGSVITHTSGNGTVVDVDVCQLVADNCNSPMVLNADGSVSYTDNAGVQTTIPGPAYSQLTSDVAAGTFTHTSGDGTVSLVDVCALTDVCKPSLTQTGPTTFTFDDGHGGTTVFDINEIDMDINGVTINNSILTFTAEDGSSVDVDICALVAANCNSPMVVNADGSITYTDNAGVVTTIPAPDPQVLTSMTQDPDTGIITYVDEDGNISTADICGSATTPSDDNTYRTIETCDGRTTVVCRLQSKGFRDNGDGTFTEEFLAQNGTIVEGITLEYPTFADKNGNAITGLITPMFLGDFPLTGDILPTDEILVRAADGSCKAVTLTAGDELVIDCPEDTNKGTIQLNDEDPATFLKGLNKCVDGAPAPLDCDADEIRVSTDGGVSQVGGNLEDGCVDMTCAPELPVCAKEGDTVFDDEGIMWQIQAGAYQPVLFTPKSWVVVMNDDPGGTTGIVDSDIAVLTSAWSDVDCIEETYTNDTCTRIQIKAVVRGMFQMDGTGGNLWSMRLFQSAPTTGNPSFTQGNGAPDSLLDTTNGEPYGQQKDYGEYNAYAKVDPGESVTLRICAQARVVNSNYVPDVGNSMDVVGLTGRFEVQRCC